MAEHVGMDFVRPVVRVDKQIKCHFVGKSGSCAVPDDGLQSCCVGA